MKDVKSICMTDFAKRHFDPGFGGTKITDRTYEDFIEGVNMNLEIQDDLEHSRVRNVRKGDYEFSRLISFDNFTNARLSVLPLLPEYYPFIRTGYSSRNEDELPVLSEWLELPKRMYDLRPVAKNLTIVLYSKEQVIAEAKKMKQVIPKLEADWCVVAILAHNPEEQEPMKPITMLRNAAGKEYGGNGEPINEDKYRESVEFWSKNISLK